MRKEEALRVIGDHSQKLRDYFVKSLSIFGSVARDEAGEASDIDILVEFEPGRHVGLFTFIRLKEFLEEILHCPVDLATNKALREEMREQILKEAIHAA